MPNLYAYLHTLLTLLAIKFNSRPLSDVKRARSISHQNKQKFQIFAQFLICSRQQNSMFDTQLSLNIQQYMRRLEIKKPVPLGTNNFMKDISAISDIFDVFLVCYFV